ncbi:MAG: glycosyltransferase family 4 protein [Acidobacteriota bacterium]|nr:glycosyltransferase family 4 protein [Acidobacteriota bacterium]
MHILMIAPEPFFEPRGTPFSEYHRIRALLALGHTVDLVTYPFGRDVELPGLRVIRCMRPPFLKHIGIGPSWAKVPLDLTLAAACVRMALTTKYDAIHSHEEGGAIGIVLAPMLGLPHLYDMHSSLPQQIANFGQGDKRWLATAFGWLEKLMVRRSKVVIVICPQLEDVVREVDRDARPVLIENAPGSGDLPLAGAGAAVRASLGIAPDAPVVLYTGTFEHYQGLDLLFASMAVALRSVPHARLVLAGGHPPQIEAARVMAAKAGLGDAVIFAGQRPSEEIPAYLDAATSLVSPRSTGINTPLKIYQYLRSHRPIVATRLLTHTQVLDDDTAILTEPTPDGYGAGIVASIVDTGRASRVARQAHDMAETKYSYEAYLNRTRIAVDRLFDRTQAAGGVA